MKTHRFPILSPGYLNGEAWRTKDLDEEELYNNLSLAFTDIVTKISVEKTKQENSEQYDKISIASDQLEGSGVRVVRSDYYYVLKRYCVHFSNTVFTHGIQRVKFYLRYDKSAILRFIITPPGYAFSQDRKFNSFQSDGGTAR